MTETFSVRFTADLDQPGPEQTELWDILSIISSVFLTTYILIK